MRHGDNRQFLEFKTSVRQMEAWRTAFLKSIDIDLKSPDIRIMQRMSKIGIQVNEPLKNTKEGVLSLLSPGHEERWQRVLFRLRKGSSVLAYYSFDIMRQESSPSVIKHEPHTGVLKEGWVLKIEGTQNQIK